MMAQLLRIALAMRTPALLLLVLLPLTAHTEEPQTGQPQTNGANELVRELVVQPDTRLRIQLHAGNVDVITHDGDRLRLEARARGVGASGIRFIMSHEDGGIVLRSVVEPWLSWLRTGPRVLVRAFVPRGVRLDVATAGRIVTHHGGVERAFPARSAETFASH